MARRRMFSLDIVDSDQFTELPITTRLLYFELGSRGDDDGFIANPKKIAKFADCSEEDIKTLVDKGFVYVFDSGPLVIRHWLANNQLRNDRYHETYFKNEKSMIGVNLKNKTYYLYNDPGLPDGLPLVALDEIRKKKNNEEEEKEEEFNSEKLKEEEYKPFDTSDIDPRIINQFELLWNRYPKKVGKKEALNYYNEAIKNGGSFDIIEQGLDNYIEHLKDDDTPDIHIKNGSNWFKNECWNDEYEVNYNNIDFPF